MIVAGFVFLASVIGFIGQGNVRHDEIFWQEKVEQTVAFEEVNEEFKLSESQELQTKSILILLAEPVLHMY